MRKFAKFLILSGLVLALLFSLAGAKEERGTPVALAKTAGSPVITLLNINNIVYWMRNTGNGALNPSSQSGGYFPRGTAAAIYESGLLWGGMVKDGQTPEMRVGGSAYGTALTPGKILSKGVSENSNAADVRIWRVRRDYQTADLKQDAAEFNQVALSAVTDAQVSAVRSQYEKDWNEWPWQKGAPYYDVNGNGVYDAGYSQDLNNNGKIEMGEAEEPGINQADQVLWYVVNDLKAAQTRLFYGSEPIGIEMQVTLWGYKRSDALGNVAFKLYRLIYKGTELTPPTAVVDSCFFAAWCDPDLGDPGDDYVGCDTTLSMSFVYNANAIDIEYAKYNLPPPAAGYDFLQGPIVKTGNPDDHAMFKGAKRSGYKNLRMSTFNYFAAGSAITDPPTAVYDGTRQWYNMMNGLIPAGTQPFTDNKGNPTRFPLAGDPVQGTGDLDGTILTPGDRRMQMITGPFTLAYGDTQEVVVALVGGIGGDRQSSVAVMKFNDVSAQSAYDNDFLLPTAPTSPKATLSEMDQKIIINWGEDVPIIEETETQKSLGYEFEGYTVYQLRKANSSLSDPQEARRLANFDKPNLVSTIFDLQYDASSGYIVNKPAKFGTNSGINRTFVVTQDVFTGRPLINGTDYFFVVTAYNFNGDPNVPIHSLESTPVIMKGVPHSSNPGLRYAQTDGDVLETKHTGSSSGEVIATVADPTKVNGHTYDVTFSEDSTGTFWTCTDKTANKALFANIADQTGFKSTVFDGLILQVFGANPGMAGYEIAAGARWWTWAGGAADYALSQFNGAMCDGVEFSDFWGAAGIAPTDIHPVLLKFAATDVNGNLLNADDPNSCMGYRYMRNSTLAPAKPEFAEFIVAPGSGYAFQDRRKVPMVAIDEFSGKKLDIGFLENNVAAGLVDGKYWPPDYNVANNSAGTGPREWLFIFTTEYGDANKDVLLIPLLNGGVPVMYWSLAARRGPTYKPVAGDQFRFLAKLPNSPADIFSFTSKASSYDDKTAVVDVEKIKAFPNPYYGFNPRETTAVNRYIQFNHLPERATFRIFDLAGNLVRVLEKDDPSQFFRWDLTNHNSLPCASGLYIVHIEMPKLDKTKILKVALVREQEFIEVY